MNIDYKTFRLSNSMIAYLSLDDKITYLTSRNIINNDNKNIQSIEIYIGTEIGQIYSWKLNINNCNDNDEKISQKQWNIEEFEPQLLIKHDKQINCLELNSNQTKLASCSFDGLLIITDISTGMKLFKKSLDINLTNLCWLFNENQLFEYLLNVDINGYLYVWDLIDGNLKFKKKLYNGPISCIKYCQDKNIVVIGGKDNFDYKISCWSII